MTQRMKRSGMRWRIASEQAVLTFRALIKSARNDRAWNGHHRRNRRTGQLPHQSLCRHRHRCLNSMGTRVRCYQCHTRLAPVETVVGQRVFALANLAMKI